MTDATHRATRCRALATTALALVLFALPAGAEGPALTLGAALEKAAVANEDVAILGEYVVQARAARLQVLSGLMPWLTASANLGFTEEVAFGSGTESRVVVPATDWGWGGSVGVKIVDLGLIPAAGAATKNVKAAKALETYGREEILFATAQAYVTALFARAAVAVREREVETRTKRRDEVEARMLADQALQLDLMRAELQVLEAQQALESARVDAVLALDALCLLMGEEPGTIYELAPMGEGSASAPEVAPADSEVAVKVAEALDERADLEAVELALGAAKSTKVSSWFGLLPEISFSASYNKGPESFRAPDGTSWLVSFNLTWSIFDGGYSAGKILESSSKTTEALLEVGKSKKVVKGEVKAAWLAFKLGLSNRETAAKKLEVSVAAYEMAEEKYRAGLATGLEVDDALDALAEAEIGLLGQEMGLELAWLDYLRASGQFGAHFEVKS